MNEGFGKSYLHEHYVQDLLALQGVILDLLIL